MSNPELNAVHDIYITLALDFPALREQKQLLVELAATQPDLRLEGLISLLDFIQDQAALNPCLSEELVFGPQEESDE